MLIRILQYFLIKFTFTIDFNIKYSILILVIVTNNDYA